MGCVVDMGVGDMLTSVVWVRWVVRVVRVVWVMRKLMLHDIIIAIVVIDKLSLRKKVE